MEGINKMSIDVDVSAELNFHHLDLSALQSGQMGVIVKWQYKKDGVFELLWGDIVVLSAYAKAYHVDGRMIDTRTAVLKKKEAVSRERGQILTFEAENGLLLIENLLISEPGVPMASCCLSQKDGKEVETNCLIPLIAEGLGDNVPQIWKSIWSKMLLVPYDNTMWLRYEAQPLRAGRKSYDFTVLFQEDSREGLLIGAADFSVWKNVIMCSGTDAKSLWVQSGIADEGTHDSVSHGSMSGKTVESSRFYVLYGTDYRRVLENYGDLIAEEQKYLAWMEGVPFGFNSWAGLAFRLNADNYQKTGQFLREVLQPAGYENNECTYMNLDAGWSVIPEDTLISLVKELHDNGQKAGIYDSPFAFFGDDVKQEIPGAPGHCFEEILLKDSDGVPLAKVDGAIPFDVTHPIWKMQMVWKLSRFVKWDFDYVKLDFLSHGGMEGCHYDKSIHTGRQAITVGYTFISQYLSQERIGKPFFISFSIAPLFPCGFSHARRFSCDAFGTNEDVEYVLNAQTYAWWQSGRLYQFNDPDHICLLKGAFTDRDSLEGEARARYTSAVIGGTVMMLSDDYERPEARRRAELFATNREVNDLAASMVSFCPVESANASASAVFTAVIEGKQCLALFHWKNGDGTVQVDCSRAGIRPGVRYRELWSGKEMQDEDGVIRWKVQGCDAILLKEV